MVLCDFVPFHLIEEACRPLSLGRNYACVSLVSW
jgi:hypothetical protein